MLLTFEDHPHHVKVRLTGSWDAIVESADASGWRRIASSCVICSVFAASPRSLPERLVPMGHFHLMRDARLLASNLSTCIEISHCCGWDQGWEL